ncbi:MAG: ABC transporter ATP-binding protein [Thermoplasmata archaeon]
MPYISVVDLHVVYESLKGGRVYALRSFEMEAERGQFISVVGPSGCGKTTFLKVVGGIIERSSGDVEIGGRGVDGPGRDRAFVFQENALLPWLTTLANVTFGLSLAGVPSDTARAKANEWLERVGLTGFEDHYPHELSQGMKQRVGIARAFVMNPDILLMDEPFASVDAQTRETLQGGLLRIWREERKTVLFVTHNIEEAIYLSDRVVVMTPRPGRARATFEVNLSRPRTYETRASSAFQHLRLQIWQKMARQAGEEPASAKRETDQG